MKKIFLAILIPFFIFSCSSEFDKNNFQKVEEEKYSYLIPKNWDFEIGEYSKIIETKVPKENNFNGNILIKVISKNQTGASFQEFDTIHINKKNSISNENIKIDGIDAKRFTYKVGNIINEVIIWEKGDILFKAEINYLENSDYKQNIENIINSIKLK